MTIRTMIAFRRSTPTLENETALAGCALGCAWSSSDEFEAAIIDERRAAGMYRSSPWWPVAAGTALLAIVVVFSQF